MAKILIVDDDESVRKLLRFRLKGSHEIIDTGSAEEGLVLALQEKPDAILLDLMMPKYSGFEVCQTIAALSFTRHIPIIIVSGASNASYRWLCESLGAKDYIQKPVDFEVLDKKLAKLTNGHSRAEEEPRVRLRVMLKLRSADGVEGPSEVLTVTETIRATGFLCGCPSPIKEGATFDVFFANNRQHLVGKAKAACIGRSGIPGQHVEFTFLEKPSEWILQ